MLSTQRSMLIAAAIAAAFAVSACDRADVGRTPGATSSSSSNTKSAASDTSAYGKSSSTDTSSTPSSGSMASSSPSTSSSSPDTSTASKAPDTSNMVATARDDTSITSKVRSQIQADPNLKPMNIKVDTKDGTVTLSGTVSSQDMKEQAHQIAAGTPGVANVVDNLSVKNAG